MQVAQVDSIGQGRVWTGVDALRIGLVDELGGLEAATAEAARRADLQEGEYRLVGYPEQKDFFQELRESLNIQARSWLATEAFGEDAEMLHRFEQVKRVRSITGIKPGCPSRWRYTETV